MPDRTDKAAEKPVQNSEASAGLPDQDILQKDVLKDRNLFMEMIQSLKETVRTSDRTLTKSEIAVYFKDMGLSEDQQEMVYDYLYDSAKQGADFEKQPEEEVRTVKKAEAADQDTADGAVWKGQSIIRLAEESKKESGPVAKLPESAFFQMYLKDMEKILPCTEQEEDRLYDQLIRGEKTAVQKLSEQWMLRTLELAKKYTVHADHLQDVIQEGNMAVFLTLSNMLGSETETDFRKTIKKAAADAMEAYEKEAEAAKDMDHSLLAKAALVYEAQKFLAENLQRMPSAAELSQYTRLKETELEDILSMLKEKK